LTAITFVTIRRADSAVVREVSARARTTAAVTAVLLRQHMEGLG